VLAVRLFGAAERPEIMWQVNTENARNGGHSIPFGDSGAPFDRYRSECELLPKQVGIFIGISVSGICRNRGQTLGFREFTVIDCCGNAVIFAEPQQTVA
jgi:hypothetical protein